MVLEIPNNWLESVRKLVSEASASPGPATVRAALAGVGALEEHLQGRSFRVGIVRTFTIETQLDVIRLALSTIPCRPTIEIGELENIEQILLDPESKIMSSNPDAILVLWRLEELSPRLLYGHDMTDGERERAMADVIDRIQRLCSEYLKASAVPLFLSTVPVPYALGTGLDDLHSPYGWHRAVLQVNDALLDLAACHGQIYLFDFASWAAAVGHTAFDLRMDLYARQPIANRAVMTFGAALANCFRPLLQPRAKLLALDLDNVLWGGLLGEDGISGLKIAHDFPGNIYRRIQLYALTLKSRGVLLALLSKNNPQDVEKAFSVLPDMPLKLRDFAAIRVNWREKHENLKDIAHELNIGLDSVVFLDDQAFEREQMGYNLPAVRVLSASEDPLQILGALVACRDFDVHRVSLEDAGRNEDYAMQTKRRELELASRDKGEFLFTLGLRASIARVNESTIPRMVQMLGKTNQFNVTTRRHTEADVRRMLAGSGNLLMGMSLSDRFGDQGLIGLVIGIGNDESGVFSVDNLLLSCRAIGRGAEQALWSSLLRNTSRMGYKTLMAEYIKTPKNGQVSDLFDRFSMKRRPDSTEERVYYELNLPASYPMPQWIKVVDET